MEQGSYLLIERGMIVRGTDADLGSVAEVVADAGVDVFRGIVLAQGLLGQKQTFVAADLVTGVQENTVLVNLSRAQADQLQTTNHG